MRTEGVLLDAAATAVVTRAATQSLQIIAHEPDRNESHTLQLKEREQRALSHIPSTDPVIFLEVTGVDASDFPNDLNVEGMERDGFQVLLMRSSVVPNSIAALLLHIRDLTGVLPNSYFEWTEGAPVFQFSQFPAHRRGRRGFDDTRSPATRGTEPVPPACRARRLTAGPAQVHRRECAGTCQPSFPAVSGPRDTGALSGPSSAV